MRRSRPGALDDERVLRALCGALAPLAGHVPPALDGLAWEPIVALASRQMVTPALAWALRDRVIDPEAADYFAGMASLNRLRNAALMAALPPILAALNAIGAEPVLLKGAAALADGIYPSPEARFLGDLDILVDEDRIEAASDALAALGYVPEVPETPEGNVAADARLTHHHLPMQTSAATGIGVELHWRILAQPHDGLLPARACRARCDLGRLGGQTCRTLHPTDRIVLNIAHSQLAHRLHEDRRLDLRQLLELIRIDMHAGDRIAWPEIEALFRRHGHGEVLAYQAVFLRDLFGWAVPVGGRRGARGRLRPGMHRGVSKARTALYLLRDYARMLRRQPALALNVLHPGRMVGAAARALRRLRRRAG